jgi:hypothetical protein
MPNVLIAIPDLVLGEIDAEVARENAKRAAEAPRPRARTKAKVPPLSKAELDDLTLRAHEIRREKGLAAANEFLKGESQKRKDAHCAKRAAERALDRAPKKLTRTALATRLLILGFDTHQADRKRSGNGKVPGRRRPTKAQAAGA